MKTSTKQIYCVIGITEPLRNLNTFLPNTSCSNARIRIPPLVATHEQIMGLKTNDNSYMQIIANKTTGGECSIVARRMNEFFVSVSDHLPRLNTNPKTITLNVELPNQYMRN